jgi:hypothetical protein
MFKPAFELTLLLIYQVLVAVSLGVKYPDHVADHSPPFIAKELYFYNFMALFFSTKTNLLCHIFYMIPKGWT